MDEFYEDFEQEITPTNVEANEGNIKISTDVISTIAEIAAKETAGVAGMYTSIPNAIAEKLGAKKNQPKGVKIELAGHTVTADLYIIIKYGYKIRRICESVQESVKNNIETMTGLDVTAVNVHVEGISFDKKLLNDDETIEFFDDITEE